MILADQEREAMHKARRLYASDRQAAGRQAQNSRREDREFSKQRTARRQQRKGRLGRGQGRSRALLGVSSIWHKIYYAVGLHKTEQTSTCTSVQKQSLHKRTQKNISGKQVQHTIHYTSPGRIRLAAMHLLCTLLLMCHELA